MGDEEKKLMNPIQYQANVVWHNLSDKDTIKIYKQTLVQIWKLFKETAILLLMLFLFLIVCVIWVWNIGFRTGWAFRQWMELENPEPKELLDAIIKLLINSFTIVFNWMKDLVEKKLGVELPASDLKLLNSDFSRATTVSKK